MRSIRPLASKSRHSTLSISSCRIAVATANRIIRPTGICCRVIAFNAETIRSSSSCIVRHALVNGQQENVNPDHNVSRLDTTCRPKCQADYVDAIHPTGLVVSQSFGGLERPKGWYA